MLVLYNFDRAFHNLTGKWADEDKEGYYNFIKSLEGEEPFKVFSSSSNRAPVIYCIYETEEEYVNSVWWYYDEDYSQYEDNLETEDYESEFNVLDLFTGYIDTSQYIGII